MQYVGQTGRALTKRFGEHYRRMNKPKKLIIFCIGTLKEKVIPLLIFWFSQWKKLLMMQIQQVDLKLSKDTNYQKTLKANKFYDRTNRLYDAALLTRCYTQHALRPGIDSKINHIRHFIKIPFINKGMDFIDLPSIFRDKSVQSSIPNYFKNCEVPIIYYKYNKE